MVRRHAGTAFRGAHVFPGGRVDASDGQADSSWCDGIDHAQRQLADLTVPDAVSFHVAAVRELFEEAGVLLARRPAGGYVALADADAQHRFAGYRGAVHGGGRTLCSIAEDESLRIALDALLLFSHWVTPPLPIEGRRFDTRFFMTRVPPGQVPAHDDRETTDGVWVTPREASASLPGHLGLLGRITSGSVTLEFFHNTPSGEELHVCLIKHGEFRHFLSRRKTLLPHRGITHPAKRWCRTSQGRRSNSDIRLSWSRHA